MKSKTNDKQSKPTNPKLILTIVAIIGVLVSIMGLNISSQCLTRQSTSQFAPDQGRFDDMSGQPKGEKGESPDQNQPNQAPEVLDSSMQAPDQNRLNHPSSTETEDQSASNSILLLCLITLFAFIFALSFSYLAILALNLTFWRTPSQWAIYIICVVATTAVISTSNLIAANSSSQRNNGGFNDESSSREETSFDQDNIANDTTINLSEQTSDIAITKSGQYTLKGSFTHSVVVNANDAEVELILDGVEITNQQTAAIVGLSAKKIIITTTENSQNTLNDGGNSVYDGCIYSNAELVFQGEGTLTVDGNQDEGEGIATEAKNITFNGGTYQITSNDDGINAGGDGATITINKGTFYINADGDGIDSNQNAIINGGTIFVIGSDIGGDAGIDTDSGYVINGGTLIALGSDMIETPLSTSAQASLAFSLAEVVSKDTNVALMKDGKAILSFAAPKSFKTIIISSSTLNNGEYQLGVGGKHTGNLTNGIYQSGNYTGGEYLSLNGTDKFSVSKIVNSYGKSSMR